MRRGLVVAAAVAALAASVAGATVASATAARPAARARTATGGAQLWVRRLGTPSDEFPFDVATAGGRVFVTGFSPTATTNDDYLTAAYDTSGAPLWSKRYTGPGNGDDTT